MFATRLKELRKIKNMSQTEVARELGISQSTWALYESGNREPNFDALLKISEFFDVYTDYLLGNQKFKNLDEELQLIGSKGYVEGIMHSLMPETQLELTDIFISIINTHEELNKAGFSSSEDFLSEIYRLIQSLYLYSEGLSEVKLDCDNGFLRKKDGFTSIAENINNLSMHLKKTTTNITDNIIDDISNDLLKCLAEYFSIEQPDEDELEMISKLTDKLKGGTGNGNSKKKN